MKKKLLNIVFWGEDSFSNVVLLSLIEAGYHISLVVTPYYDNFIYKRLELTCNKYKIPLLRAKKINSYEVYDAVKTVSPDLCIISHFERLIKKPLLDIPPMGFINLHPSLLPNYRGMAPQHWPIINGETEAGITVHYVDEQPDTGNIIIQKRFPLSSDMYVSDLQKVWLEYYRTIMVEALEKIFESRPTTEQHHLKGSYYGKLTKEQCVINPKGSVIQAYNLVRGLSRPYCGARHENIIIYRAHIYNDEEQIKNKPMIKFKDGILVIDVFKTF